MEPERVGAVWGLEPEGLGRGLAWGLGLGVVIPNYMLKIELCSLDARNLFTLFGYHTIN